MSERQILVVSGDYNVIQHVRQSLRGRGFTVSGAYSHRDALYSLKTRPHDLALVDSAMIDRVTGEPTIPSLARVNAHPPIIAVTANGSKTDYDDLCVSVVPLDDNSIYRAVMQALRIPILAGGDKGQPNAEAKPSPMRVDTASLRYASADEIETLFALGRSLTEVLNLSEVLNRVVEAARKLTKAEEGMILLPDPGDGDLYLRAKVGIDVKVAENFRVRQQDTLAGSVFNSGQPVLIGASGLQKVKTEYFVKSLLYVPILLKGKPIGVLGVNNRDKDDLFDSHHQDVLLNLASYAAVAIENARSHEEILKQARELKALVDASKVINSSLALDKILPNICEQFVEALHVHQAEIFEWDRKHNILRTIARYYRTLWRPGQEPGIDLATRPALRSVIENRKHALVTRQNAKAAGEVETLERSGADSMLLLPISAGEQVFGVVQAYTIRPRKAIPASEAVMHAGALTLQRLPDLYDSSHELSVVNAFRLLEELNRLLEADWCELALLKPDSAILVPLALHGRGVWLSPPFPTIDLTPYPDLEDALQTMPAFTAQQGEGESPTTGMRRLLQTMRARSILGMPLVQRGQVQGVVVFADAGHATAFSGREVDLARALVGQAATAMENARLFHDLEASLRELKATQERLIQAARLSAMGELAAAVAHQVNNPLTTIVVDTELLLLDEQPDTPRYDTLSAIMRAGRRAAGVVRRLLATARPTDPEARSQPVNVVATIEEVTSLVKSHIERDKVKLILRKPDGYVPPVWAVPGQLDDVWLNLLLNAHDALQGREGAQIGLDVTYTPGSDFVEVLAWDNGPGIPENIIGEIFKPFFTTKPVGEGTGLGLHICRQVVERVGGTISVTSSPEQGTQFLVRLPIKRGE